MGLKKTVPRFRQLRNYGNSFAFRDGGRQVSWSDQHSNFFGGAQIPILSVVGLDKRDIIGYGILIELTGWNFNLACCCTSFMELGRRFYGNVFFAGAAATPAVICTSCHSRFQYSLTPFVIS